MTMNKIYLCKDDLLDIVKLLEDMGADVALVSSDTSSGIGSIITASVTVQTNGHSGEFTKIISDETSW